jgi:hypothetical protein
MKRLDTYMRDISAASFARYGFGHGELLARWPEVIGEELARHCEPERIKWPRGGNKQAEQTGGTLHVRAEPGRALDVQYQAPRMLERIGQFLGHGAIVAVKVTQGPLKRPKSLAEKPIQISEADREKLEARLSPVADDGLKQALLRLGQGVLSGKHGSPQEQ